MADYNINDDNDDDYRTSRDEQDAKWRDMQNRLANEDAKEEAIHIIAQAGERKFTPFVKSIEDQLIAYIHSCHKLRASATPQLLRFFFQQYISNILADNEVVTYLLRNACQLNAMVRVEMPTPRTIQVNRCQSPIDPLSLHDGHVYPIKGQDGETRQVKMKKLSTRFRTETDSLLEAIKLAKKGVVPPTYDIDNPRRDIRYNWMFFIMLELLKVLVITQATRRRPITFLSLVGLSSNIENRGFDLVYTAEIAIDADEE